MCDLRTRKNRGAYDTVINNHLILVVDINGKQL